MQNYVVGRVHTNGLENFWSLLKRTLKGTYIYADPEHLERYVDEQVFRFNYREYQDGERLPEVLSRAPGRRLTYKELIAKD